MRCAAVVLAGGRASRLGGVDKTRLDLAGRPVLDLVLAGLAGVCPADAVSVVGPETAGGPVAAIAAGLGEFTAGGPDDIVLVLAGDQPFVAGAFGPLLAALTDPVVDVVADVAVGVAAGVAVDVAVVTADGVRQHLAAAWRRGALVAALGRLGQTDGQSVRSLYAGTHVVEVADTGGWSQDIDTEQDLAAARSRCSQVSVPTAAHAVLRRPKLLPAGATVAQVRDTLANPHVHAALLVDGPRLVAVLDADDLVGARDSDPAAPLGALQGRAVNSSDDLEATRARMLADGIRRLAVIDDCGQLVGMLALKASGRGFCDDAGVAARAAERGSFSR